MFCSRLDQANVVPEIVPPEAFFASADRRALSLIAVNARASGVTATDAMSRDLSGPVESSHAEASTIVKAAASATMLVRRRGDVLMGQAAWRGCGGFGFLRIDRCNLRTGAIQPAAPRSFRRLQ